jgi:hypothetical protein
LTAAERDLARQVEAFRGAAADGRPVDCPRAASLRDSICTLAERICALAPQVPGQAPDRAAARCASARQSCATARQRVAASCRW